MWPRLAGLARLGLPIDANSSCSFIKQDLIFKQPHDENSCFVLCNEPKVLHLFFFVFSAFYSLSLKIALFCTKVAMLECSHWVQN